ncbi:nuclear transport factor 2 family protein [Pyxidicoccus sp. 3LFB2]
MSADLTAELKRVFDLWFASIAERDGTFVERNMDERFECVDPDGIRRDRKGYRAMYDALPPGILASYRFKEFQARPLGNGKVALVTGAYHGRIEFAGQVLSDKSVRFSSVWERSGDSWKCMLHHLTSLPPE